MNSVPYLFTTLTSQHTYPDQNVPCGHIVISLAIVISEARLDYRVCYHLTLNLCTTGLQSDYEYNIPSFIHYTWNIVSHCKQLPRQ